MKGLMQPNPRYKLQGNIGMMEETWVQLYGDSSVGKTTLGFSLFWFKRVIIPNCPIAGDSVGSPRLIIIIYAGFTHY